MIKNSLFKVTKGLSFSDNEPLKELFGKYFLCKSEIYQNVDSEDKRFYW